MAWREVLERRRDLGQGQRAAADAQGYPTRLSGQELLRRKTLIRMHADEVTSVAGAEEAMRQATAAELAAWDGA